MIKKSRGERIFNVFNICGMIILSLIFILPIWHVAMGSISDPMRISAFSGLILWPLGTPTLGGYKLVLQNSSIAISYANTLLYVVSSTVFGLALNILAAFVLSRRHMFFGRFMNMFVLFTMIFNGGLIPTYIIIRNLGMLNTRWAIILPAALNAYNILIMRTSFAEIPEELFEAAQIDGASYFRILMQVVLPVSKAIIAVIVLYYAVQHWNAWFQAAIYLTDRKLYPLQLTLREIVLLASENSITGDADGQDVLIYRPLIKYATIMVSIIPMMILYPFVQKYFVTGVMIGAVKG